MDKRTQQRDESGVASVFLMVLFLNSLCRFSLPFGSAYSGVRALPSPTSSYQNQNLFQACPLIEIFPLDKNREKVSFLLDILEMIP